MPNFKLSGKWNDTIKDLQGSFFDTEAALNDARLQAENQQLINKGYPVNLNDPVSFMLNKSTGQLEPYYRAKTENSSSLPAPLEENIKRLQSLLPVNAPVPVVNTYLGNKNEEGYLRDNADIENSMQFMVPGGLLKKVGSRAYKLGEQYVDNIPGLSSLGENSKDDSIGTAGALIQAGGRVLPLAGAFWMGINAGPTAAGTLDEARKKGYIR